MRLLPAGRSLVGLSQPKGAEDPARGHVRQVTLAVFLGAELIDGSIASEDWTDAKER